MDKQPEGEFRYLGGDVHLIKSPDSDIYHDEIEGKYYMRQGVKIVYFEDDGSIRK